MGIGRILAAGSALGATGVLIAAPIALAAAPSITVAKSESVPGSRVEITTECAVDSGFREPGSSALDGVKRVSYDEKTQTAKWAAVVKKDAKPGAYEITFTCQDKPQTARFAVAAGAGETTKPSPTQSRPTESTRPKPSATKPSEAKPSATTSTSAKTPKGAPETGGGGTSDDGNGLALAGGAAALAAGAGFGVWALRRRRASAQG
ncbi:hypothetical protein [Crossiella sp. NPDC003009]